jgi:hypothetical protein
MLGKKRHAENTENTNLKPKPEKVLRKTSCKYYII